MFVAWSTLAAVGGGLVIVGAGRFLWRMRPQPEMSGLPTTALERLGWIGLAITGFVGVGLAVLVVVVGVTDVHIETMSARSRS
jgi:membrane protein YqaA with SNARE-associated domain